ncbi:unnamed protein product, partial [Ilex paraguariensis]
MDGILGNGGELSNVSALNQLLDYASELLDYASEVLGNANILDLGKTLSGGINTSQREEDGQGRGVAVNKLGTSNASWLFSTRRQLGGDGGVKHTPSGAYKDGVASSTHGASRGVICEGGGQHVEDNAGEAQGAGFGGDALAENSLGGIQGVVRDSFCKAGANNALVVGPRDASIAGLGDFASVTKSFGAGDVGEFWVGDATRKKACVNAGMHYH